MAKPEITNLHILGFFNERISDVTKLDELLTTQESHILDIDTAKLSKKSLKRKLAFISGKKRTSSYMRYKLPRLKCKKKGKRAAKKGDELKCRRERRNRSLLNRLHCIHQLEAEHSPVGTVEEHYPTVVAGEHSEEYSVDHSRLGTSSAQKSIPRWLETHFWHRKRFQTKLCYGYILPLHHKARGKKFLHEAVKSSVVIHDSSYIRPLQIIGKREAIQLLLRQFTVSYHSL